MDVLMGPTIAIDVSAPQAVDYSVPPPDSQRRVFLKHRVSAVVVEKGGDNQNSASGGTISISRMDRKGLGLVGSGKSFEDDSSDSSSSSVGAPDDSEEEEEGVESNSSGSSSSSMKKSLGSLGSLDALEDSLPGKRGLSNYFTGKSKSFASLADASLAVSKAKDLEKPEHPFNKRRRILMANKWTRRSSFYSWTNPKSMPLLTLNEDDDKDDDEEEGEKEEEGDGCRESLTCSSSSDKDEEEEKEDRKRGQRKLQQGKFNNSFKCHSCFSLTDLQQQQRLEQNLQ